MKKEKMKQIILDYIKKNNHVTYVELARVFEDNGFPYRGELVRGLKENPYVLFWSGWNEDAFGIIRELEDEEKIHSEASSLLIYLIDGGGLDIPIVKTDRIYKTPHWCPSVFCAGKG